MYSFFCFYPRFTLYLFEALLRHSRINKKILMALWVCLWLFLQKIKKEILLSRLISWKSKSVASWETAKWTHYHSSKKQQLFSFRFMDGCNFMQKYNELIIICFFGILFWMHERILVLCLVIFTPPRLFIVG